MTNEPKELMKIAAKLRKMACADTEILAAAMKKMQTKFDQYDDRMKAYIIRTYKSVEGMAKSYIAEQIKCTKFQGVQTIRIFTTWEGAQKAAHILCCEFDNLKYLGLVGSSSCCHQGETQLAFQFNR